MSLPVFSQTQWRVLLILMLVNFANHVAPQIIFLRLPAIRRDFSLSFEQLGRVATAFRMVPSIASFSLGVLADRVSERAVISAAALFWSGAAFFGGSFRFLHAAGGTEGH